MRIESAAGEFDFSIEALAVRDADILITGKMGVWEAETVMTQEHCFLAMELALEAHAKATRLPGERPA